ncbi:DUF1853 family protein [Polaribacter sp.]|uniref:DUF1853 family protein n=1 Tax=Polaribacter sp. TaxID=1920175 RepID=UPI0025DF8A31|nr:DUF1853 family protein [Polaribacter sp.]
MDFKTKEIQKRYEGYLATSNLWNEYEVFGLHQFELDSISHKIDINIDDKIRLGKYIERFVSYHLSTIKEVGILAENIQIQKDKRTLGELDCLLTRNEKPVHLEIIYKFYLYDDKVGTIEIEHFIGPNRKDALIEKLNKLKEKQLPLLCSNDCKPYLDEYDIEVEKVKQEVLFKAQLFLPYAKQHIQLTKLNTDCEQGFYINRKELGYFKKSKFYIPSKKDWLIKPQEQVSWITYANFSVKIKEFEFRKFSPLVWIKSKNGELSKCFVVWWP